MNILLLYPEFPDTFLMFKHALKFAGKRSISPPLGLLTVAALLPAAWEKRLVDLNAAPLTDADLAWADLVFVSAMVVQRESAHTLIQRLKQAGATVVAGGPLFTMEPDGFPDVDHLVLHEAELTLPRFLADLAAGQPQPRYTDTASADICHTPAPLHRHRLRRHLPNPGAALAPGEPGLLRRGQCAVFAGLPLSLRFL